MNKRIQQLFSQSINMQTVMDSRAFGHWPLDDADLEQFAKLVIQECVCIIQENDRNSITDDWDIALRNAVDDINDHFNLEG